MYLECFPRLRQNVPTPAVSCGQTWTSSFMVKNVGGFHFVSMFFTCRRTCSLWPLPPLNVHHIRWTVWTGKNIKTKPQLRLLHCFTLLTPGPGPEPEPNRTTAVPAGILICRLRTSPGDMIIRLGRLTPGYFRLLQRQVAGEVQLQPQDRALNQIAMMLAIMGLSLSYYSAKQMTEKVQPRPLP